MVTSEVRRVLPQPEPRAARLSAAALALLLLAASPLRAQGSVERRNWFNDPFFQISSAIADCPPPLGPFITEAERRVQSHHRAEKGTTCWLAGLCERPNFYLYDAGIAEALRAQLAAQARFEDTSLWITVQGRVVYIEGCVRNMKTEREIEAFVRGIPHVQQAIALVAVAGAERVPYTRRDS